MKITLKFLVPPLLLLLSGCCGLDTLVTGKDPDPANCIPFSISVSGGGTYQSQGSGYTPPDGDGTYLKTSRITTSNPKASRVSSTRNGVAGSSSESIFAYRFGVYSGMPVHEKITLESGLYVAGKGGKNSSGSGSSLFEEKLNMTYVDLPVVANYHLGQKQKGLYVFGGLQPSYLLNAKMKTNVSGNEDSQKVTDQYKKLDLAGIVGMGYTLNNGLRLSLGYDHGLSNVNSEGSGGFETRNRSLKFSLGYSLGRKK